MNYTIFFFFFILILIILIFTLIFLKIKLNKTSKDLEKRKLELISSRNFISQRNEYLKTLKKKIKTLEKNYNSKKNSEFISKNIKRNIDNIINSEKTFDSFEKQFTRVYPGFFKKLIDRHGKLTSTDLRLCAYLRMNQNSSEIAQITGASIRTIESRRYRLRKKLNLRPNNDILNYLITI
tara:strand:- start:2142 stop:2681 length:540 start_codon:yes stop_codon:yes gene_type:complete